MSDADYLPSGENKRFSRFNAPGAVLCLALIIFSIQFLFPWNDHSWQRFYRSFGTGILILSVLWVVLSNPNFLDRFHQIPAKLSS